MEIHCQIDMQTSAGDAFGTFFIKSKEICFPWQDWTDFAVAILDYWISQVIKYDSSDRASFTVFFMEGPYYLLVEKNGENALIYGKKEGEEDFQNNFVEIVEWETLKRMLFSTVDSLNQKKE